jgi:hypothetical protein
MTNRAAVYLWRSAEEIGNKYRLWDIRITQFFHRLAVLWSLHSSSDGFSLVRNRHLWTDISICCLTLLHCFPVVRASYFWLSDSGSVGQKYQSIDIYTHWHDTQLLNPGLYQHWDQYTGLSPGINSGTNTSPYQAGMTWGNTSRILVGTWGSSSSIYFPFTNFHTRFIFASYQATINRAPNTRTRLVRSKVLY